MNLWRKVFGSQRSAQSPAPSPDLSESELDALSPPIGKIEDYSSFRDPHGQPALFFNDADRQRRGHDEFIGLVRGLLGASGELTEDGLRALARWIKTNTDGWGWPLDVIGERIHRAYAHGVDHHELAEITEILRELIGTEQSDSLRGSTELPLTHPPPTIYFEGRRFVLTGRFYIGSRAHCEQMVIDRGGICTAQVGKKTDFLVIGRFASRDWLHTSYGRKIEEAVQRQREGSGIAIVSEDHWKSSI